MTGSNLKATARIRVGELVQIFRRNEADYLRAAYNETQTRTDFITPLLAAFGWDVHNAAGKPLGLREVIEEATVELGEKKLSKKPDYELRLARQRKLFVEAKKPSIHIDRDKEAAFQTRRYGYSASLPIAILTNFHQLAVYDCQPKPDLTNEAHVARVLLVRYDEFETRFDELWSLLSRETIYSGDFDHRFSVDATRHGAEQFDDFFLRQVRSWRERLARDIHRNTPGFSPAELTYAVQLFLSRLVFLRICEDRDIERYETLRGLAGDNSFDAFRAELRRADTFYGSGLFRVLDDARLGVRISDDVLSDIINELYYPQSPYTFAVVETEVLGEIYEQFLGEIITIDVAGAVEIVNKPEFRESGGVVADRQFYQFGRSQSLTKFDSPKIILPILSLEAKYAYDEANIMMTGGGNGPYYMIRPADGAPESNFFLLAVLHHPLSEAIVRTHTSSFRGGYYSHGKQFIKHLPIPLATPQQRMEIEDLVGQLIDANDTAQAARTPHQKIFHERNAAALREQVESRVSALFGLSGVDIARAKAVPVPG